MATGDLTTLANVKSWLGITDSTDDTLLTRMITAFSATCQSYMNRDIYSKSYTETYDGVNSSKLFLQNYPVTAIASLSIDNVSIPLAANSTVTGYLFNKNTISLNGYSFTRGNQNISVTYTAGYATTPFDLEQAVLELIGYKYRERTRIGEASKSLAGEVVSFDLKDLPPTTKLVLNQYKRVTPV